MGTDKLRKYIWSKINSINMESLLVEPGARLEENKLQLLSAKRGQCGVVTVQLLCC